MDCEDKETCSHLNLEQQYSAHLERLLIDVCNEFMDINNNGQFVNHRLSDEINTAIGIAGPDHPGEKDGMKGGDDQ